jgi:arylformamidase
LEQKMKIYDITRPLVPGMATYPGDPPYERILHRDLARGDACTVSCLSLSAHSGTHLDAPAHFLPGGGSVGDIHLSALIGLARVIVKNGIGHVTAEDLGEVREGEKILIRTQNSDLDLAGAFREDYVALTVEAAQRLADAKASLVGIDYLSIEPFGSAEPLVHRILLGAGIVILEGLNLCDVGEGTYFLIALPLSIPAAEGAPVRAILLKD